MKIFFLLSGKVPDYEKIYRDQIKHDRPVSDHPVPVF